MAEFILYVSYIILFYFALLSLGYCILLAAALPDIFKQFREACYGNLSNLTSELTTASILTVIVPVYNEKTRVFNAVFSILNSDYSTVNIILVNDASTDNTMDLLKEKFSLYEIPPVIKQVIKTKPIRQVYRSKIYPNLSVIDKEHGYGNGGDSVNVGINACVTPLYMTLDADTVLEPEALGRMVFTFLSLLHCVVLGGAVYVLNGNRVQEGKLLESLIPSQLVPGFQSIEYVRSFLFGRSGWNTFSGALCYAGAFTLFEKQAVIEIGGYDALNFAYDAEITVHLHSYMRQKKYPYTAYFTSNAFTWTEVPSTIKHYWRQRNFWQRGLLRTFTEHMYMFMNPRYGIVGMFNVPFNFFFEIMGPVVEFISYFMVVLAIFYNILAIEPLIWALVLAWGFTAFLNLANFLLNIITYKKYHKVLDTLKVLFFISVEMLWFRQIRAACCFLASIQYVWNRLRGRPV